jgi:hypothetical protein
MRDKNSKKIILRFALSFYILIFAFCIKGIVFAAELNLIFHTQEIAVGQQFQVDVILNTEGEQINAIEGKIIFPQDLLELKKINDGNSIINFWIEKPKSAPEGQIMFSGIVPGGYNDSQGLIFSITFLAKKEGSGTIEFNGVKALRNDGKGTEVPLTISNFQFSISNLPAGEPVPQEVTTPKTEDRNPPEEFTPQVAADPAIFEGKWFLVFATQDKGSGIDHYEVLESRNQKIENRNWRTVESPYLLKDQKLKSFIYVKAVDKAGNERIATLAPRYPLKWYEKWENWIIIIIVTFISYLLWKVIKSKIKYQKSK